MSDLEPREVWLDQIPDDPPPVLCVECGDPIEPFGVMIKWVGGHPRTPLCRICFDKPPLPDDDPVVPWWERGAR